MLFLKSILYLGLQSLSVAATSWIVPGAVWTDTKGQKIDAHGGGIVKVGSTFYWSGQSAGAGKPYLSRLSFYPLGGETQLVTLNMLGETPYMYSSTDLLNWTPLGAQAKISGMWRPKIAKPNGNFWVCTNISSRQLFLKTWTIFTD